MSLDAGSETHSTSSHRINWFSPVERPVGGTIFVKPAAETGAVEQPVPGDADS